MAIVIQSKQQKGKEKNEKSSQLLPSANVTPPPPLPLLIPLLYYITGESAVYGNNDRDIFERNRLFRRPAD